MTPEQIAELRQSRYNATVVHLRKHHSDLMVLRVKPDTPRPPHKPGQYTTLGLGKWEPRMPGCQEEKPKPGDEQKIIRRSYSISCPIYSPSVQPGQGGALLTAAEADWLEFYIVLVRDTGDPERAPELTPRLFMLREGERVQLGEKIAGHYTLDVVKPDDTVIFLGTGTGEAPHNYMVWQLLSSGHRGRVVSACCVRYQRDLGYLATHQALMRQFPQYKYLSLTTREESNLGHKLYIQDLITGGQLEAALGRPLDPATTHVFLCGNPKMIGVPVKDRETGQRVYPEEKGVIEILESRGFQADIPAQKVKGNVHFEEYW
jgi:ferredoxin--NADP+ reductase